MENNKEHLETVVSVLNKLEKEGYETQFKATDEGLLSLSTDIVYQPDQIKVENFFRFEGESNPDDTAIVYAVVTHNGEKGTITDSFNSYGDENVAEFMKQVEEIQKVV
jgi:hypothetical protein